MALRWAVDSRSHWHATSSSPQTMPSSGCQSQKGLIAGSAGVHRLPRQIGLKPAMGYLLTGRHSSAARAFELSLVNDVVRCPHYAKRPKVILKTSWCTLAVRATKASSMQGLDHSLRDAFNRTYPEEMARRASLDAIEGPRAFSESAHQDGRANNLKGTSDHRLNRLLDDDLGPSPKEGSALTRSMKDSMFATQRNGSSNLTGSRELSRTPLQLTSSYTYRCARRYLSPKRERGSACWGRIRAYYYKLINLSTRLIMARSPINPMRMSVIKLV